MSNIIQRLTAHPCLWARLLTSSERRAQNHYALISVISEFHKLNSRTLSLRKVTPDSYAELWSLLALCAFYGNIIHMMRHNIKSQCVRFLLIQSIGILHVLRKSSGSQIEKKNRVVSLRVECTGRTCREETIQSCYGDRKLMCETLTHIIKAEVINLPAGSH